MIRSNIIVVLVFSLFLTGCQKLLVFPTVNNGLRAEGRYFEAKSFTWVEVKILLPVNTLEWQPVFDAGPPAELSVNSDDNYTYIRWKINRNDIRWFGKNEVKFQIRANAETHQVSVQISPLSNRIVNFVPR